jgi:hypothetical protein
MSHSAIHYGTPHAGDQVWISPAAGIHGQGSWWALVVSTSPALVKGAVYLRVVPLDDVDGEARVREFYARAAGLLIRRQG